MDVVDVMNMAVCNGNIDLLRTALLMKGCTQAEMEKSLTLASTLGQEAMVRELISAGSSISASALWAACRGGYTTVVDVLLDNMMLDAEEDRQILEVAKEIAERYRYDDILELLLAYTKKDS